MASAHKALKPSRLRAMARLYRAGVDGVTEQLADLTRTSPDALGAALGFDRQWVDALSRTERSAELVVEAIESTSKRTRDDGRVQARHRAQQLASDLASHCNVINDGAVSLDFSLLSKVVRASGYRWLGLPIQGRLRLFERRRLSAILRECRTTRIRHLCTELDALHIRYETSCGRGHLRLLPFEGEARDDEVLIIPFPAPTPPQVIHQDPPLPRPPSAPLDPPRPPDHRPVLARILTAFSESVAS